MRKVRILLVMGAIIVFCGCDQITPIDSVGQKRQDYIFVQGKPVQLIEPETGVISAWEQDKQYHWINASKIASPNVIVAHTAQRAAYVSTDEVTKRYAVIIINKDITEQVVLLDEGVKTVDLVDWSPDDSKILLRISFRDELGSEILSILDVKTSTVSTYFQPARTIAWRPQSNEIIASLGDYSGAGLYLIDAKRENFQRLRQGEERFYVAFSPDGNHLAYGAFQEGKLFVYDLNDQTRKEYLLDARWDQNAWSPKEDKLLLQLQNKDSTGSYAGWGELVILDLITGETSPIGKNSIWYPVWSPDGRSIAYVRAKNDSSPTIYELVTVNINTKQEIILVDDSGPIQILAWR